MINSVSTVNQGAAGGQQVMATQIGSVLGISVLSGIATSHPVTGAAPAWILAYLVGGAVAVGAALLGLALSRHDRRAAARADAAIEAARLSQTAIPDLEQAP